MLKYSDNPPIRPDTVRSLVELKGRWWVAHTRARFEKTFAWDIFRAKIGYFMPMVERVRFSGGRKRRTMLPLFTSYVFICGSEQDRYLAMSTNRLFQTIEVPDQAQLIRELAAIEKALDERVPLDPYPHVAIGRRCRINAGPFLGTEGIVVRRSTISRIVLQVSILGVGAAMEIEADLLEVLD
jgi:transcriptional antiterminator RfaH